MRSILRSIPSSEQIGARSSAVSGIYVGTSFPKLSISPSITNSCVKILVFGSMEYQTIEGTPEIIAT